MTQAPVVMSKEEADGPVAHLLDIADYPDETDITGRRMVFAQPSPELVDIAIAAHLGTKVSAGWIAFLRGSGYALCFLEGSITTHEPAYICLDTADDLDLLEAIAEHGNLILAIEGLEPVRIVCSTVGLRETLARREEALGLGGD